MGTNVCQSRLFALLCSHRRLKFIHYMNLRVLTCYMAGCQKLRVEVELSGPLIHEMFCKSDSIGIVPSYNFATSENHCFSGALSSSSPSLCQSQTCHFPSQRIGQSFPHRISGASCPVTFEHHKPLALLYSSWRHECHTLL